MARPSNPEIRARLRERAIDYVMQHGFAAVSLRPMAKKLGTTARMLVYHFGSREALMREVLMGIREREDVVIRRWFQHHHRRKTPPTLAEFLRWYWQRMGAPEARPTALLIFELYALALRDPAAYPGVMRDPIAYWRGLSNRAGVRGGDDAEATLLLAATRGLLLDVTATGDRVRVTKALRLLASFIERSHDHRECGARRQKAAGKKPTR
jgi:AcrR family transcriptional regulator